MNDFARDLRKRVARAQQELASATADLLRLEQHCRHEWGKAISDPLRTEGYSARNWMGPIRNGEPALPDVYVAPTVTPRWRRTCAVCGRVEETTNKSTLSTEIPV